MTAARPAPVLVLAVFVGGAVGGVLRWGAGELVPDGAGFPQTILAVNVVGSFALALLPALAVVRHYRVVAVALGPGLLGGFTTLSTATDQTRELLGRDPLLGATHAVVTLVACLLAVAVGSAIATRAQRAAPSGGDA